MTTQGRFQCALTRDDEPPCTTYAPVAIADATGDCARAYVRHAAAALDGIDGARINWADTRGLNQFERKALELTEEISQLRSLRAASDAEPQAEAEP
jgi:hypothetical protein